MKNHQQGKKKEQSTMDDDRASSVADSMRSSGQHRMFYQAMGDTFRANNNNMLSRSFHNTTSSSSNARTNFYEEINKDEVRKQLDLINSCLGEPTATVPSIRNKVGKSNGTSASACDCECRFAAIELSMKDAENKLATMHDREYSALRKLILQYVDVNKSISKKMEESNGRISALEDQLGTMAGHTAQLAKINNKLHEEFAVYKAKQQELEKALSIHGIEKGMKALSLEGDAAPKTD